MIFKILILQKWGGLSDLERLKGEDEKLAFRIWNESNRKINPRYFGDIYRFINSYELLALDSMNIYRLLIKECLS